MGARHRVFATLLAVVGIAGAFTVEPARAQYFSANRVQYKTFRFQVLGYRLRLIPGATEHVIGVHRAGAIKKLPAASKVFVAHRRRRRSLSYDEACRCR